jgi:hypothetical protein
MTRHRPEKSPRNPTLNEALQRVIDEALAPWAPGTLLRRRSDFRVYLRSEPNDRLRACDIDWDDLPSLFDSHGYGYVRQRPPDPILWMILDNRWDDRKCVVWIRVIALGEPARRGWLRGVESNWKAL